MKQPENENSEAEEQAFPPPLVTETLQYRLMMGNIAKQGSQQGLDLQLHRSQGLSCDGFQRHECIQGIGRQVFYYRRDPIKQGRSILMPRLIGGFWKTKIRLA
jgi:hypothetical protein